MRNYSRLIFASVLVLATQHLNASCPTPTLTQRPDVVVGFNPLGVAMADFDKDGKLDLATPRDATVTGVYVQKGNGDGTFQTGISYPFGGSGSVRIAAADLNADTWPDLVTANYNSADFSVLLNDGDGTFAAPLQNATVGSPGRVIVFDANMDNRLDVAVVGITAVQVHLGNGDGTFTGTISFSSQGNPEDLDYGDFDGNGTNDVVVYGKPFSGASTLRVHYRSLPGDYTFTTLTLPANSAGAVLAGDFNGDARDDLVASDTSNNTMSVFLSTNGAFPTRTDSTTGAGVEAFGHEDINEDGIRDLVLSCGNTSNLYIRLGQANGTFGSLHQQFITAPGYLLQLQSLAIGDFDGDFRSDILFVDSARDRGYLFKNNCTPRYSATALASSPNPSAYNENVTLTATVTVRGTVKPTGSVSFFEGATFLGISTLSPTTSIATLIIPAPAPSGVHTFTATYNGDAEFGASTSAPHAHTVRLPPFGTPTLFSATGDPVTGNVTLQWQGTEDAQHYEVWRMSGGAWGQIGTTPNQNFLDTTAGAGGNWFYRVRGINESGIGSGFVVDAASTVAFTHATLAAGSTIRATDVTDLRTIINGLRAAAGLAAYSFTDTTLANTPVKAVHVTDLRQALTQASTAAGMSTLTFARPITSGLTILANDLSELRTKVR